MIEWQVSTTVIDGRNTHKTGYGTIIIWDVAAVGLGRALPVHTLQGHVEFVSTVAWSEDGLLASGGDALQVWNMDPEEWVRQACLRAGRNLTQAEWRLYFPDEDYTKTCEEWPVGW